MQNQDKGDTMADKIPIGTKPYYIAASDRIEELSQAINRYVYLPHSTECIKKWAKEIIYQCELIEKLDADKN